MTSFGRTLMSTHHVVLDFTCVLTHHVILETSSVKKKFLTFALLLTAEASLGDACGAECGAAAAFRKRGAYHFYSFFHFLYFDILPLC